MKEKLVIISNIAPKYREGIYKKIDEKWDCEWYFGENKSDIKGLNLNCLRKSNQVKNIKIFGNWYWQKKIIRLNFKKNISNFLILGDPYCISTWVLCFLIKMTSKKRIFFWTHGWYGKESKIKIIIKKVFFKFANIIFLYGNYAKNLMLNEGFDPNKLKVIHNSLNYEYQLSIRNELIETNIYKNFFENNNPVIIFIGRLTKAKKINILIQALDILKKQNELYNLIIIGDGEDKVNLLEMIENLNLKKNVWFYGESYDEKMNAELIYNADICVSPGNVGLTGIHSLMFGTPVITHDDFRYQMPEFESINPNLNGIFFERDNPHSLAKILKNWFNENKNNREIIRKNCYKEIDNYWTPKFQIKVLTDNIEN